MEQVMCLKHYHVKTLGHITITKSINEEQNFVKICQGSGLWIYLFLTRKHTEVS